MSFSRKRYRKNKRGLVRKYKVRLKEAQSYKPTSFQRRKVNYILGNAKRNKKLNLKEYLKKKYSFLKRKIRLPKHEVQAQESERESLLNKIFNKPSTNIVSLFKFRFRKKFFRAKRRLHLLSRKHRRFARIKIRKRRIRKRLKKRYILLSVPAEKRKQHLFLRRIRKFIKKKKRLVRGRRKRRIKLNIKAVKRKIKFRFKRRLRPGRTRPRSKLRTKRRNSASYYFIFRKRRRKRRREKKALLLNKKPTLINAIRFLRKAKFNLDFEIKLRKNIHNLIGQKILNKNNLSKSEHSIKVLGKKRADKYLRRKHLLLAKLNKFSPFFKPVEDIHYGTIYITNKPTNTFTTVVSNNNPKIKKVLFKASCGLVGYTGPKRSTIFARTEVAKRTGRFVHFSPINMIDIVYTNNKFRRSFLKILKDIFLRRRLHKKRIRCFLLPKRQSHGFTRHKKPRRT